jgi:hypothetical protein
MTRVRLCVTLVAIGLGGGGAAAGPNHDPFAFLSPDVVVDARERARLDAGESAVRVLPGRDGHVSISAAIRIDASGDRLLAWGAEIEMLQKGRYVPEIGRFSNPPRLEDLAALVFEDDDLGEIRECRPGKCGVKLSEAEIAQLQPAARARDWKGPLQNELRRIVLQRARAYLAEGDAGLAPYHDHSDPVAPAEVFAALVNRLGFLPRRFRCLTTYLCRYPQQGDAHVVDSFLYWSKESLGVKPIISITHLTLARFENALLPEAVVVAKQVFATHYKNASVTVTAITRGNDARYLVYVHRSQVDVIHGLFGAIVRRMIERRVRGEAPAVLMGLRTRLESGDPPD